MSANDDDDDVDGSGVIYEPGNGMRAIGCVRGVFWGQKNESVFGSAI